MNDTVKRETARLAAEGLAPGPGYFEGSPDDVVELVAQPEDKTWSGFGPHIRVISMKDIAMCPEQSLSVLHYRDDGTCQCRPDDAPEWDMALDQRVSVRELIEKAAGGDSEAARHHAHLIAGVSGLPWRSVLARIAAQAGDGT